MPILTKHTEYLKQQFKCGIKKCILSRPTQPSAYTSRNFLFTLNNYQLCKILAYKPCNNHEITKLL